MTMHHLPVEPLRRYPLGISAAWWRTRLHVRAAFQFEKAARQAGKVRGLLVTQRGVSASDMVTKMGVRPHGGP